MIARFRSLALALDLSLSQSVFVCSLCVRARIHDDDVCTIQTQSMSLERLRNHFCKDVVPKDVLSKHWLPEFEAIKTLLPATVGNMFVMGSNDTTQ